MKKLLAMVLAIVMVLSLCTFQVFAAGTGGDPYTDNLVKENPTWYGGTAYKALKVDVKEITTGPYVVGDHIEIQVIFTNSGSTPLNTSGKTLKISYYNTYNNVKDVYPECDLLPRDPKDENGKPIPGNLKFNFGDPTESKLDYTQKNKGSNQVTYPNATLQPGGSITCTFSYDITAHDLGKVLKNYVIIFFDGDTSASNAVGKYIQSSFDNVVDKVEDVGTLTVTNTVASGDLDKYFDYIVTLTDTSVNEVLSGVTFTKGVGRFSLKSGESKTIEGLVAGTGYRVEESNYDGYTVSIEVDTNEYGSAESVGTYAAKGTVAKGSTATVAFTNKIKVAAPVKPTPALTYHLNPPDGSRDQTWVDSAPVISNEKNATFDLKGFENTNDGPFKDLYVAQGKLKNGKYTASDGTVWYFAGWETSKANAAAATTYDQVEYAINNLDDNVRGYTDKGRPSHTITVSDTALGNNELYAVWFRKPGMVGYAMTLTGAKFPNMTMGAMILGDNGLTHTTKPGEAEDPGLAHAQKYVVWNDGGHYYDKLTHQGDEFHVTTATPTNPDGYNFLGWFVKNANKPTSTAAGFDGTGADSCPDPNTSFIAMPGSTIHYGAVETIYSLDALWGRLTGGASVVVPYDGGRHTVNVTGADVIRAEFPESSLDSSKVGLADAAYRAFFAGDTLDATESSVGTRTNDYIRYYVTVEKDGEQFGDVVELTGARGLPTQTEPGIYTYTISARLQIDDPSHGNSPSSVAPVTLDVGAVSLQLVILPRIEVQVTKAINGRDFKPGDSFEFNVTVTNSAGVRVEGSPITIDSSASGHMGAASINFPVGLDGKPQVAPGTYTVTVSERGTAEEFAAKGMIKAPDVTFTFDIAVDEDTGAVTVSNIKGKDIDDQLISVTEKNITVPVTMKNEYKTGSLTLTNTVFPEGQEAGNPFTFTVTFTGDGDFSTVATEGATTDNTITVTDAPTNKTVSISIKSTGTVKITGIPVGTTYEVTETNDHPNFDSSLITAPESGKGSITMDELDKTVEIENYFIEPGNLTIYKTVTNDRFITDTDKTAADAGFKVTVKLEKTGIASSSISVTGGTLTNRTSEGDSVTYEITVKDGERVQISGIPDDTYYEIKEDTDARYTVTYNGKGGEVYSGTTVSGAAANVVITNSYQQQYGQLTINKEIAGNSLTKPGRDTFFDVQVTLTYKGAHLTGVNRFGGITFTDGVATVRVSPGTPVTLTGIPLGLGYSIEELNVPAGAEETYENDTGTIGSATSATVTNTYTVGTFALAVTNRVVGDSSGSRSHTFRVNLPPEATGITYSVNGGPASSVTGGTITFTLSNEEDARIEGIPTGASYTVTETDSAAADYTSVSVGAMPQPRTVTRASSGSDNTVSRTLTQDTTVTFINAYTGTLKLTVRLTGEGTRPNEEEAADFTFTINSGDPTFNGDVGTLTFENGVATTTLRVGVGAETASRTWTVPAGSYTVIQSDYGTPAPDSVTNGTPTVRVESGSGGAVTVINNYVPSSSGGSSGGPSGDPSGGDPPNNSPAATGTLTLTKRVTGEGADLERAFTFTVRSESGGYSETFTLGNGDTRKLTLPAGLYTVTEDASVLGYRPTYTVNGTAGSGSTAPAAITAGGSCEVIFTNTWSQPYTVPDELNSADHFGYIVGYPGGTVEPDGFISRAEAVTILFRLLKDEVRDLYWSTENSFSDVHQGEWYNNAISTVANMGLIGGYPDGTFQPNGLMSRAELAQVIARFFAAAQTGYGKQFDDVAEESWYGECVRIVSGLGIMTGVSDTEFVPDASVKRSEAMATFNRLLGHRPLADGFLPGMITWPDNMNPAAWYYADIQEATNSHECEETVVDGVTRERWTRLLPVRDWSELEKKYE